MNVKKLLSLLLAMGFVFGSSAQSFAFFDSIPNLLSTNKEDKSGSNKDEKLKEDQANITPQGAAAGAVIGGALGALTGSKKNRGKRAIIGTVVGGVAGALLGNEIGKIKDSQAKAEDKLEDLANCLEKEIAQSKKTCAELKSYNRELEAAIKAIKSDASDKQDRAKLLSELRDDAESTLSVAQKQQDRLVTALDDTNNLLDELKEKVNTPEYKKALKERDTLAKSVKELKIEVATTHRSMPSLG